MVLQSNKQPFSRMDQIEAFADNKLNAAKIRTFELDRVEINVGKEEKCWLLEFSHFPTMFSTAISFRVVKSCDKELMI